MFAVVGFLPLHAAAGVLQLHPRKTGPAVADALAAGSSVAGTPAARGAAQTQAAERAPLVAVCQARCDLGSAAGGYKRIQFTGE